MSAFESSYWKRFHARRRVVGRAGAPPDDRTTHHGFRPCLRKGCGHDEREHTTATAGDGRAAREIFGACQHAGCNCFSYVLEGLRPAYERLR